MEKGKINKKNLIFFYYYFFIFSSTEKKVWGMKEKKNKGSAKLFPHLPFSLDRREKGKGGSGINNLIDGGGSSNSNPSSFLIEPE
jgi:hypothetical protein